MTNALLITTLNQHGVETVDNGHMVSVKEHWSIGGKAGFDWKTFYPHAWTMKDLLRYLGY